MTDVLTMADMLVFGHPKDDQRQYDDGTVYQAQSSYSQYGSIYNLDGVDDESEESNPLLFGGHHQRDEDFSFYESGDLLDTTLRSDVHTENRSPLPKIVNYQSSDEEDDDYMDDVESQRTRIFKCSPLHQTERTFDETSFSSEDDSLLMHHNAAEDPGSLCGRGFAVPGWHAYNKSLDTNPVRTKALTSLCGWFLGDFVTQTVIEGGPFDFRRSITLSSFGFFFHGPVGHFLYNGLDELIVGRGPKEVAIKIVVDQLLWCPVFMVCYFTYLGLANGDTWSMIITKIGADLFKAVQGSWKVWPLAHTINFKFVSTKHRIIYINCIEVCFIMFLSFLGNK